MPEQRTPRPEAQQKAAFSLHECSTTRIVETRSKPSRIK
jgi:hypothetical protein